MLGVALVATERICHGDTETRRSLEVISPYLRVSVAKIFVANARHRAGRHGENSPRRHEDPEITKRYFSVPPHLRGQDLRGGCSVESQPPPRKDCYAARLCDCLSWRCPSQSRNVTTTANARIGPIRTSMTVMVYSLAASTNAHPNK